MAKVVDLLVPRVDVDLLPHQLRAVIKAQELCRESKLPASAQLLEGVINLLGSMRDVADGRKV